MEDLLALARQFKAISVIDILLVTLIFYAVLRLFAGTQGVQLLRGILVVVLVAVLASSLTGLTAFSWLVRSSGLVLLVAIPVIFQPELRRLLERLGRSSRFLMRSDRSAGAGVVISELISACTLMSQLRRGALIVLEEHTGLQEYVETGVRLRAIVSAELLMTIFQPGTPLHDGAVIIRNQRIEVASAVLPLTPRTLPDVRLGTRHRAAIGVTEGTDALALIVSEETGIISAARNGRLIRRLDEKRLRRILESFFEHQGATTADDSISDGRSTEIDPGTEAIETTELEKML